MRKIIYIFLILCGAITSCKKEKTSEDHPELIGTWKEMSGQSNYAKLEIKSDSKGTLYDCHPGDCGDIQFRKWRIKNNHLYYGVANDLGEITQYPRITSIDILITENDTIKTGERYLILNHSYYVDISL